MKADYTGKIDALKIREVRKFICDFLKSQGVDENTSSDIELVVSEMLTNVYKHSYNEKDGDVVVKVDVEPDRITISIRDFGKKFKPVDFKNPDPEVLQDHGYGLFIASQIMDKIEYVLTHKVGTEVILTKYIS